MSHRLLSEVRLDFFPARVATLLGTDLGCVTSRVPRGRDWEQDKEQEG